MPLIKKKKKVVPGPIPYVTSPLCPGKFEGLATISPHFPMCLGTFVLWAAERTWGSQNAGEWNIWGEQKNLRNPIGRGQIPSRR